MKEENQMKIMKKLAALALVGTMTFAFGATAFAATGVSADEQALLDKAKAKAQEVGVDTSSSAQFKQYYAQAEEFLASNELTSEQTAALAASVDSSAETVVAEMKAQGVTTLSALKEANPDVFKELQSKVTAQTTAAAEKVGIKVSVDASGNYTVATADNTKIADSSNPIKQTGFGLYPTIAIAVAFAGAVAVCLVVASKKRFIEEA
jgi:hypothetical protein